MCLCTFTISATAQPAGSAAVLWVWTCIFTALKTLCALPVHPSLPPTLLETTDLFLVSIVLPFPECQIVGIILYVAFSDWLLSLNNMHLRLLHVFSWFDIAHFFLALNNILLYGIHTYIQFHSTVS